jgi:hypothetical protein
MHSCHGTSTAQEALDALMMKFSPRQLAIAPTSMEPTPSPASPDTQVTPLPDAPATVPEEADSWKTVGGKATQWRKQKAEADRKKTTEVNDKPPTTKNGRRGKNSHQPRPNNTSTKKTWADVIKSGGINVQIVLGNGNLGLTILTNMRGERRGGAAQRLTKKREGGDRGVMGSGKDGPEMKPHRGNKGGKMEKDGRGRVEEWGEPGMASSVRTGHLDEMTQYGRKHVDNGETDPTHL